MKGSGFSANHSCNALTFTPRFSNPRFRFSSFDCISLLPAPDSDYTQRLLYERRRWLMEDVRSEKMADSDPLLPGSGQKVEVIENK